MGAVNGGRRTGSVSTKTAPASSPGPGPGSPAWPRPVRPRLPGWLAYRLQRALAPNSAYRWLAGAEFVQTQFVFDVAAFGRWMAQVRDLGLDQRCRILAGVGPVRSLRALGHLRGLPGVHVPDDVDRRLRGLPADRVAEEGLAMCAEIIEQVRQIPGVSGVHVMAPGYEQAIPAVLGRAGLTQRPGPDGAGADGHGRAISAGSGRRRAD